MSSDLKKLYPEIIKAHNERPFHFEKRLNAHEVIKAYNPICGDRFELFITSDSKKVIAIHFHGFGCAISKASTSILVKSIEGKTQADALAICNTFLRFIDKETQDGKVTLPDEFLAFSGVHDFPERYDCATLSWKEVRKRLEINSFAQ
jgi:nitrogen fixation protein NifU and related proteins